ncbi:MAG TPA: hypothetical protein VN258_16390 [Mobilitalea sp.]|nr:hypothetical protein [Mobilitalea sp.]
MKKENIYRILLLSIGLILWLIFLCDHEMSRYGIYTIFSYNMHELLSMVPFLCLIFTFCWLISIIVVSVRNKDIKSDIFFGILLLVLCVSQFIYIHNQSQIRITSIVTSIEKIDREKLEIIIDTQEYSLTLDCPMLVQDLLQTDGTEYLITYENNKTSTKHGKICMIQSVN